MTTAAIREKLAAYLKIADDKKVKAIYTMVEEDISIVAEGWDEEYEKELNRRKETFENGTAKTYSWEETKAAAVKKVQAKRK